jgi:hypothetical protein
MSNDETGTPLTRRVPGAARLGSAQPAPPVLPESVLTRMQAAIDAEHGNTPARGQGEPNTEPLPRVTTSGSPSKPEGRPASPSGVPPEAVVPEIPAAAAVRAATSAVKPPRADEPLRSRKALRATQELRAAEELRAAQELRAAEASRVAAAPPELAPAAAEPEFAPATDVLPAAAAPIWAGPTQQLEPPAAEMPRATRPAPTVYDGNQPTPGTIGWLWPDETDARGGRGGGGGRRWQTQRGFGGGGWRFRTATLVALGAVVVAAAGLAIGLFLRGSTPVAGSPKPSVKATAPAPKASQTPATTPTAAASVPATGPDPGGLASRTAAATWIAQQVTAGTVVACDPQMCPALTATGIPAVQQVPLGMNSQSLSNAGIVVVTPTLRALFTRINPSLANDVVPEPQAVFGQISIHLVYPGGAAAYQAALSQDVQARMQVGQSLLSGGNLTASATAQSQLTAGDVDPRLLLALQALASQHPVDVIAFTDSGPGAGPGIPFRAAELSESDPASILSGPAYLQALIGLLRAHASFPAVTSAKPMTLPDGETVIYIEYAAPSPVGLLTP